MSEVKVDSIGPRVDSGTLTIGASGDTITIPSGATFTQSGTMNASAITAGTMATARLGSGTASSSTFLAGDQTYKTVSGTTINNNADNRVITGSGTANTLNGEADLTFDGDTLLVKNGSSGSGGAVDHANELVVEHSDHGGISILTPYDKTGTLAFGDGSDNDIGYISYNHTSNMMTFSVNADGGTLKMSSDGNLQLGTTTNSGRVSFVSSGNEKIGFFNALNNSSYSQSVAYFHCARNTQNGSYLILEGSHGGGSCFFVADSGNVTNANNSYGQSSDERIKKDIIDANSQWDDIKAVKVKNFKYKSNDSITQLGVVAQDLETSGMNGLIHDSLPTVQDIEADSTFGTLYTEQDKIDENIPEDKKVGDVKEVKEKVKSVKYSVLYMKAIKCLQEAQTKIETLETENTDIKARITTLENA